MLMISQSQKEKNPKVQTYLRTAAWVNICFSVNYAASTFWTHQGASHDFVYLARAGYHPVLIIVTMVSIPIILENC